MQTFRLSTTIHSGPDALDRLAELAGCRVLVVTDAFLASTPLMTEVCGKLGGADVRIYDEVRPNPGVQDVAHCFAVLLEHRPDAVVAVGGGSPIDTAKAVSKLAIEQSLRPARGFYAIPTTSGSGSEVTAFSVITDSGHAKVPLFSVDMVPDVAILYPEAVRSLPARVTADTGMDAASHALEGYVAVNHSPFSDAMAEKALELIMGYLPRAYADGDDMEARQHLHEASCMAGMAFENAGIGIVHSMSHALGGAFGAPHGRLNAMLLPHVMEFNCGDLGFTPPGLSDVARRYARLARQVGVESTTDRGRVLGLIEAVRRLNATLHMPRTVAELGIDRTEFARAIPALADAALHDFCTAFNPVQVDADDLARLLLKVA